VGGGKARSSTRWSVMACMPQLAQKLETGPGYICCILLDPYETSHAGMTLLVFISFVLLSPALGY